jgi:hypothetical protein
MELEDVFLLYRPVGLLPIDLLFYLHAGFNFNKSLVCTWIRSRQMASRL